MVNVNVPCQSMLILFLCSVINRDCCDHKNWKGTSDGAVSIGESKIQNKD